MLSIETKSKIFSCAQELDQAVYCLRRAANLTPHFPRVDDVDARERIAAAKLKINRVKKWLRNMEAELEA